jgi:hypothetical protein
MTRAKIPALASTTLALAALTAWSPAVHAQETPPTAPAAPAADAVVPPPAAAPAAASPPTVTASPPAGVDFTLEDAERARPSAGRLTLGILGSAVGGSFAGYGTARAICGHELCLGGGLAGLGVNLVVTPVLAYGIGRLGRGRGTLAATIYGAGVGLGIGTGASGLSPAASLTVGLICMPIFASLFYEMSSGMASTEMKQRLGVTSVAPYAAPVALAGGTSGGVFGFGGRF